MSVRCDRLFSYKPFTRSLSAVYSNLSSVFHHVLVPGARGLCLRSWLSGVSIESPKHVTDGKLLFFKRWSLFRTPGTSKLFQLTYYWYWFVDHVVSVKCPEGSRNVDPSTHTVVYDLLRGGQPMDSVIPGCIFLEDGITQPTLFVTSGHFKSLFHTNDKAIA